MNTKTPQPCALHPLYLDAFIDCPSDKDKMQKTIQFINDKIRDYNNDFTTILCIITYLGDKSDLFIRIKTNEKIITQSTFEKSLRKKNAEKIVFKCIYAIRLVFFHKRKRIDESGALHYVV